MSTQQSSTALETALTGITKKYRSRILDTYIELKRRQVQAYYGESADTAGLSAGKFCEAMIRFLQHELTGSNIRFGKHIPNFAGECEKLIRLPKASGHDSLRVIIPRGLIFIYTLRGKRGIGHIGGDVDANQIDLKSAVQLSDWIICEIIRIYHKLSLEEAQAIVDSVQSRLVPEVWEVGGKKRVLQPGLSYKEKALLLMYSEPDQGVLMEDLFEWTEHSNKSGFRKHVLRPLHGDKLIEYDETSEIVYLSPIGNAEVEANILAKSVS